jgi:threonine/homoserine/homoserine lactone efflux protein
MLNITEVARRGFWAGPAVALGHSLLEFVTVLLLAFGLSPVLSSGAVPGVVGLLGGAFLLWIGGKTLRSAPRLSLAAELTHVRPGFAAGPVVAGVVASISNPYWLVWWATVGAGFTVTALALGVAGLAVFYLGHISADFVWYTFVAGIIATGRRFMTDPVYRALLASCAVFLLALGGFFILSGIGALMGLRLLG